MLEIFQFQFITNAVIACILASVVCGVIGSLVVVNRLVFISGGIAHCAYGGIGLAFFLGIPYIAGSLFFTCLAAFIVAIITLKAKQRFDTIIGILWAAGMAFGVIMVDLTPGYNPDLMSYLFGSILAVTKYELLLMAAIAAVSIIFTIFFYNDLAAMSYDEEFARVRGVPVNFLYIALILIIALCIVIFMRIAGLILIIALMTIPPYIAERHTKSLYFMMIGACILGFVFSIAGLIVSYRFDLTCGPSIIMIAGAAFFLSFPLSHFFIKNFKI